MNNCDAIFIAKSTLKVSNIVTQELHDKSFPAESTGSLRGSTASTSNAGATPFNYNDPDTIPMDDSFNGTSPVPVDDRNVLSAPTSSYPDVTTTTTSSSAHLPPINLDSEEEQYSDYAAEEEEVPASASTPESMPSTPRTPRVVRSEGSEKFSQSPLVLPVRFHSELAKYCETDAMGVPRTATTTVAHITRHGTR